MLASFPDWPVNEGRLSQINFGAITVIDIYWSNAVIAIYSGAVL